METRAFVCINNNVSIRKTLIGFVLWLKIVIVIIFSQNIIIYFSINQSREVYCNIIYNARIDTSTVVLTIYNSIHVYNCIGFFVENFTTIM